MAKKIYDIVPPRHAHHRAAHTVKKITREKKHKAKREGKKLPIGLIATLVFVVVVVVLGGGYLYFALAKATIIIWPNTQEASLSEKITADVSSQAVDLEGRKIPAQLLTEEKELWQEFSATGTDEKGGKAQGTIRVYNKHKPATPISLKSGTHFMSDSGKSFTATTKFTIPAAKISGTKIIPGYIDIKVVAEEGGEAYNIGPSVFSVPKLVGTQYYSSVYAESTTAMAGGFASDVKVVTSDDIENAKTALTKALLEQTEAALREKIDSDTVLLDKAISKEVVEAASLVKAGTEVDKFNYRAKVKVTAVVFKKDDVKKFATDYILSLLGTERPKTILEDSFVLDYTATTIDITGGKVGLNLTASSKAYLSIYTDALLPLFAGRTEAEISNAVASTLPDQISRLNVNMWPFWVKKAPKDLKKISVQLEFE